MALLASLSSVTSLESNVAFFMFICIKDFQSTLLSVIFLWAISWAQDSIPNSKSTINFSLIFIKISPNLFSIFRTSYLEWSGSFWLALSPNMYWVFWSTLTQQNMLNKKFLISAFFLYFASFAISKCLAAYSCPLPNLFSSQAETIIEQQELAHGNGETLYSISSILNVQCFIWVTLVVLDRRNCAGVSINGLVVSHFEDQQNIFQYFTGVSLIFIIDYIVTETIEKFVIPINYKSVGGTIYFHLVPSIGSMQSICTLHFQSEPLCIWCLFWPVDVSILVNTVLIYRGCG